MVAPGAQHSIPDATSSSRTRDGCGDWNVTYADLVLTVFNDGHRDVVDYGAGGAF